ncbi:MAG: hypothetical protein EA424_05290 [Planctomycetaceae bacterium]|nr:MAG: hypothetical protein EA424_05290 [Planctomycetaceae bacterium]
MIDPKQHSENRGLLESVLRYIPGFRGYLEKDYRQESDYLLRKSMADRLQRSKQGLDDFLLQMVNAGQLDRLADGDRAKNRLDRLILKMRAAVRGYSGFFDFVRVDMALLDRVYEHDMAMVQEVETLGTAIEQLAAKPDPAAASIADILQRIDSVEQRFDQRGKLLEGLGS